MILAENDQVGNGRTLSKGTLSKYFLFLSKYFLQLYYFLIEILFLFIFQFMKVRIKLSQRTHSCTLKP